MISNHERVANAHGFKRSTERTVVILGGFRKLASAWQLSPMDCADLVPGALDAMSAPTTSELSDEQILRLSGLVGLYKGLHLYFSEPLADRWVQYPNSAIPFHGLTPISFMKRGGVDAILETRDYVDAIRGGV